jgi:integrase
VVSRHLFKLIVIEEKEMAAVQTRISKDGNVSYRVQVRIKGHPMATATFSRLTDARTWGQQTEADIKRGLYFKVAEGKKRTMGEAIDKYFDHVLAHRKNPVNQKIYLQVWKEKIGAYLLSEVTTSLVVETRNSLVGRKNRFGRTMHPATANRYTQALGHVFTIAKKEWGWVSENPVLNITKFRESRGRVRFLSDSEREILLSSCRASKNVHLYKVVILALSTGARKNEILSLKWQDVDFKRGQIVLHETKNGERRLIALQGYARKILEEHAGSKRSGCEYVFPSDFVRKDKDGREVFQPIDIRTAWENALRISGIENFRFHDLRHSAASYLAMNSASLAEIAGVLGHKNLQMVGRYAHLSEAHTIQVVARMNERIFGDAVADKA